LANASLNIHADLTVIPMQGWQRKMWFDETCRSWVPTSPAMPHLSTTIVYPGTCLCEGTSLSEGRGTALPFEVVGAPWMDGFLLAKRLEGLKLPGVIFRPCYFIPSTSKHSGQTCSGVQLHITERNSFKPVWSTLNILAVCQDIFSGHFQFLPSSWEGHPPHFDLLVGNSFVRTRMSAGEPLARVYDEWQIWQESFRESCKPYLLYS
jgi:uncharacterized protein YbbC (DUF1343 family)